jgi:hypothetical protein
VPWAWGIEIDSALEGRAKECRGLFCFGGSCLDAPIHDEFVIRDVEGLYLAEDSTTRLGGRLVRLGSIALF